MSERLQLLLDEKELREIRRIAKRHHMTVSQWVRKALREARALEPSGNVSAKLQALRSATRHAYPAPEPKQMLEEISRGYLSGPE